MRNFKLILLSFSMIGCQDDGQPDLFFDNTYVNSDSNQIIFSDIHQLHLSIGQIKNEIDESGFSPKLNIQFTLSNPHSSVWSQAWIALNIDILLNGKKLASITKADVIQDHALNIQFQQLLPSYGIKTQQISIHVSPIGWMPTYPLHINSQTEQSAINSPLKTDKVARVK